MYALLAEANSALYVPAWVTFFIVMNIVGFALMLTDKRRFNRQKARSDQMMAPRKKPGQEEEEKEEPKKKKGGRKEEVPEDYTYQGRVPDKALFAVAILFGAVGELLAMLLFRHKWYKWAFRNFIPLLSLISLAFFGLILYVIIETGSGSAIWTN